MCANTALVVQRLGFFERQKDFNIFMHYMRLKDSGRKKRLGSLLSDVNQTSLSIRSNFSAGEQVSLTGQHHQLDK